MSRNASRLAIGIALLTVLFGCVTTEDSKGPKLASTEQRLQAQLDLARGYLEKRDWARARPPLERALKIAPRSSEAHTLLALVYQEEGEKELAEREYRAALRYDSDNAQTLNNYGSFLYSLGRYEDARAQLSKAVRDLSYSKRALAYDNLGATELQLARVDAAEDAFRRALMLDANLPRATLELAEIYFGKGDYPLSKQHYDKYLRIARQTPRSLWLGIRLSRAFNDQDQLASYALLLRNLYPGTAEYRLYQESLE